MHLRCSAVLCICAVVQCSAVLHAVEVVQCTCAAVQCCAVQCSAEGICHPLHLLWSVLIGEMGRGETGQLKEDK